VRTKTFKDARREISAPIAQPFSSLLGSDGKSPLGWHSEGGLPEPKRVVVADDTLKADTAYHLACEGTAMLWRGDFQNAKLLLQAMARRLDQERPRKKSRKKEDDVEGQGPDVFNRYRLARSQRARTLGMLLIPFEASHKIPLRRAPDVREACEAAHGEAKEPYAASLRELLGLIGAYEWQKKGVEVPALDARIHPHYGVFAPIRHEYVQLVAETPFPTAAAPALAYDIGTGTGVLAMVLARRGIRQVIAAERDPSALACAKENIERLAFGRQVEARSAELFPEGRAPLIVCNPPWIPARPTTRLESAVYDAESSMLRGFLGGLAAHLTSGGQGWLILSDIAEHLGLRSRETLMAWIDAAGLEVKGKIDKKPTHPRVADERDPLHAARAAEVTSLWRLEAKT